MPQLKQKRDTSGISAPHFVHFNRTLSAHTRRSRVHMCCFHIIRFDNAKSSPSIEECVDEKGHIARARVRTRGRRDWLK
jgi:hypothetical protein